MIYTVDSSCWYEFHLRTLILISLKFAVRQKHVHSQMIAAAASAAAAAAAYSRPGSTNHGIFLITLCFADSIEEPYNSPTQNHGNQFADSKITNSCSACSPSSVWYTLDVQQPQKCNHATSQIASHATSQTASHAAVLRPAEQHADMICSLSSL